MNLSCLILVLTLGGFMAGVTSVGTKAPLTVVMNAAVGESWFYFNQSAKGTPSQRVPLPDGIDNIPDCPIVPYAVNGCRNPVCYDAVFIRTQQNGIASLLNVTANLGNSLGHSLIISPSGVLWV
jgi:hypothetical protein